jgi:hypothetical protein
MMRKTNNLDCSPDLAILALFMRFCRWVRISIWIPDSISLGIHKYRQN